MFGRGRFNLARFNLAGTTTDILVRVAFVDQMAGQMGAGADFRVESITLASRLEAAGEGAAGVPARLVLEEELEAAASGASALPVAPRFAAQLGAAIAAGANYSVTFSLADSLEGESWAGADIHLTVRWGDRLQGQTAAGADLYASMAVSAILSAFADAGSLEELVTVILGSIPPGSELRIDSDNFTVTLDGENVLYMQEGDWIDLERQLWGVVVNAAGSLEGEIIYTERYL